MNDRRLSDPSFDDRLTVREAEVLSLVAQGLTNAQIGEALFLSASCVSWHLDLIYSKSGARNRVSALNYYGAWSLREGVIRSDRRKRRIRDTAGLGPV